MFGVHHFTAIIHPPQCAILAVGGGHTYIGKVMESGIDMGTCNDAMINYKIILLLFLNQMQTDGKKRG